MTESHTKTSENDPILLGGGPHGLGDPDDKRLRKVEKDIIIPKRLREEAVKKCGKTVRSYMECAEAMGLLMIFKCREEYQKQDQCLAKWLKHEPFVEAVTQKYLEERSHYRRTGQPMHLHPVHRTKKKLPQPIDEEFPS